MSFYMSLQSNAPKDTQFHRENTSSQFRVRLPDPIKLSNDDWEVALVELQYPFSWNNVCCDYTATGDDTLIHSLTRQNEIEVVVKDKQYCIKIPMGNYRDIHVLLEAIRISMKDAKVLQSDEY